MKAISDVKINGIIQRIKGLLAVESNADPGCYYRMVNGEKEWLNPPMIPGVEYRTTERWQGRSVYTMLIDCGMLPVGQSVVNHNLGCRMIRASGHSGSVNIPYQPSSDNAEWITLGSAADTVYIYIGSGVGEREVYAQVWYVKG